jgi:hypothetical protein
LRNRFGFLAGLFIISTIAFGQDANKNHTISTTSSKYWTPEKGQWMEDSDAPGAYGMNVTGSAETGLWVMYAKVNPGGFGQVALAQQSSDDVRSQRFHELRGQAESAGKLDCGLLPSCPRSRLTQRNVHQQRALHILH